MGKTSSRLVARLKRKRSIRKNVFGSQDRPRLSVFRSLKYIYAQIIDDTRGITLVSASTFDREFVEKECGTGSKKEEVAKAVGKLVGKRALDRGITKVVFDRNGFLYHGRVRALSNGAREAGLSF